MVYRFALTASGVMVNDRGGPFVKYEDYQKLEAELASLGQQVTAPEDDGWIDWGGGECPVSDDARVEVKFKGYDIGYVEIACWLDWGYNESMPGEDIIAYRIVKSQEY